MSHRMWGNRQQRVMGYKLPWRKSKCTDVGHGLWHLRQRGIGAVLNFTLCLPIDWKEKCVVLFLMSALGCHTSHAILTPTQDNARSIGVRCRWSRTATLAPCCNNSLTISTWRRSDARCNGIRLAISLALTIMPYISSIRTNSIRPYLTAKWSGVSW